MHARLSGVVAHLGHTDMVVIGDAGLPIPAGPEPIDLAVRRGLPGFFDVLEAVAAEMMIQRVSLAAEMLANAPFHAALIQILVKLGDAQGRATEVEQIPHQEFKAMTAAARAIVRTGEYTPYENIILHAGVCF